VVAIIAITPAFLAALHPMRRQKGNQISTGSCHTKLRDIRAAKAVLKKRATPVAP
jgi:hypothetical protein